ncbi:hypothetical protein [Cohnella sp. GCM10027633]|uniref:hypothetical protein n=1 Tax=unclassified Cohnella TaxID=2636738 RepID=UPI0036372279
MRKSKFVTLYRWRRLPARLWRVLRSRKVPAKYKLSFIVPVALYWVLPDLMPLLPIDDLAVTAIAANWFVGSMESKYRIEE